MPPFSLLGSELRAREAGASARLCQFGRDTVNDTARAPLAPSCSPAIPLEHRSGVPSGWTFKPVSLALPQASADNRDAYQRELRQFDEDRVNGHLPLSAFEV